MNPRSISTFRYLSEAAPAITIVLLLLLPVVLPNRLILDAGLGERQAEVARVMEEIPFSIGPWAGSRIDVPAVAFELLHPNAVFSRQYDRIPRGPTATVIMVHCSDLRDMRGHYPPICYPYNGWTAEQSAGRNGRPRTIEAGPYSVPVREYHYSRAQDYGGSVGIRIFNFFVLPDGTLSREMDDIYEQSERLAVSVQGACQVQIITSLELEDEAAVSAADDLLAGMKDLFIELGVAKGSNDA